MWCIVVSIGDLTFSVWQQLLSSTDGNEQTYHNLSKGLFTLGAYRARFKPRRFCYLRLVTYYAACCSKLIFIIIIINICRNQRLAASSTYMLTLRWLQRHDECRGSHPVKPHLLFTLAVRPASDPPRDKPLVCSGPNGAYFSSSYIRQRSCSVFISLISFIYKKWQCYLLFF